MPTNRLLSLVVLLLVAIGQLLPAQSDTISLDMLGGESVEVGALPSPIQQITNEQDWFKYFRQLDSIYIAVPEENSPPQGVVSAAYEELPYELLFQDYQNLQYYLRQHMFHSRQVTTWLDSLTPKTTAPAYPLTRASIWQIVGWEPRILGKLIIVADETVPNPRYLAPTVLLPDSLTGKAQTLATTFAAYHASEEMIWLLQKGLSVSSNSSSATWFMQWLVPIRERVDARAESWYARQDSLQDTDFLLLHAPKPWFEKGLVAEVLAETMPTEELQSLYDFQNQLNELHDAWTARHQLLAGLPEVHQRSLTARERRFCRTSLAELGSQLKMVAASQARVIQIRTRVARAPNYARSWEMLNVYHQLRDHFIGQAETLGQVYRNQKLNRLAYKVYHDYQKQVWDMDEEFRAKARRVNESAAND